MPRDSQPFQAAESKPFRAVGGLAVITAEGTNEDGSPKLGSFEGVAYTGAPMDPGGWGGTIICDLAGFRIPSQHRPVLRQHDDEQIVGHTEAATSDDGGVKIKGLFSGEPQHVSKVTVPAKNGFKWQLSIGALPIRTSYLAAGETATVNGREITGPMTISHETELKEISFVPLGADGDTSVSVSASWGKNRMYKAMLLAALKHGNVKAGKYSADDVDKMSEDQAKSALKECMDDGDGDEKAKAKAAEEDEKKAKAAEEEKKTDAKAAAHHMIQATRAAVVEEEKRIAAIRITAKGNSAIISKAIEQGWDANRTELEVLRASRAPASAGLTVYSTTTPTLQDERDPEFGMKVLEAALMKANRHQFKLNDESFYYDKSPDPRLGISAVRRVPEYLQAEAQGDLKTRYTDKVQQFSHTLFKEDGISLHNFLRQAFRANGNHYTLSLKTEQGVRSMMEEWDQMEKQIRASQRNGFYAEGASNISISNVLANVMNKFALQGYLFGEQSWREIAGIRPVNDFKPVKSINLLGDVMYKQLGPSGEIDNASLGDQAFANQAAMFARMLTIPYMHVVNDDLSMLSGVPQKIGQGAIIALNNLFWNVVKLMFNGTTLGDDGVAFFRTTSVNTGTSGQYRPNKLTGAGSAISSTALQSAKALFDNQCDPNGNPLGFDGQMPRLIHGPTNWRAVTELMTAPALVYGGGSAALQPNVNVWNGMMKPVMTRYIDNPNYINAPANWALAFDPAALPMIEACFLGGVDTPAVLQAGPDYQFDRLGITIRGSMAFGVTQQNFRGAVFCAGS